MNVDNPDIQNWTCLKSGQTSVQILEDKNGPTSRLVLCYKRTDFIPLGFRAGTTCPKSRQVRFQILTVLQISDIYCTWDKIEESYRQAFRLATHQIRVQPIWSPSNVLTHIFHYQKFPEIDRFL